jgi:hypothetical protein
LSLLQEQLRAATLHALQRAASLRGSLLRLDKPRLRRAVGSYHCSRCNRGLWQSRQRRICGGKLRLRRRQLAAGTVVLLGQRWNSLHD